MLNCESKLAGIRLRAWGLVGLLGANALTLVGITHASTDGELNLALLFGGVLTISLLFLLSTPDRD